MVECVRELSYRGGLPVYLSRYVIFGGEGRHAALRFFNASEISATGIRYRLDELDAEGNVLFSRTLEQDIVAERGCEFGVYDADLADDCVSLEATVEAVYSGEYEYVASKDGISLRYGGARPAQKQEEAFLQNSKYSVSRKKRKYILYALVAILGITLLFAGVGIRFGIFDGVSAGIEVGTVL